MNLGPFNPYKSFDLCKKLNSSNIFVPYLKYNSLIYSPESPLATKEARIEPVEVPATKSTFFDHPGTSLPSLLKSYATVNPRIPPPSIDKIRNFFLPLG